MENKNIMTPKEHIEELQADFIEELQNRGIIRGIQFAMNRMDFSKEPDKEKVATIENALCAITILDAVKQDSELQEAFMDYASALAVETVVDSLGIHAQPDTSGLPPELQAILDLFTKRI